MYISTNKKKKLAAKQKHSKPKSSPSEEGDSTGRASSGGSASQRLTSRLTTPYFKERPSRGRRVVGVGIRSPTMVHGVFANFSVGNSQPGRKAGSIILFTMVHYRTDTTVGDARPGASPSPTLFLSDYEYGLDVVSSRSQIRRLLGAWFHIIHVLIHLNSLDNPSTYVYYKNKNTLQLWDRMLCRNSYLQAVCDTPIARITGCVSSLRI